MYNKCDTNLDYWENENSQNPLFIGVLGVCCEVPGGFLIKHEIGRLKLGENALFKGGLSVLEECGNSNNF